MKSTGIVRRIDELEYNVLVIGEKPTDRVDLLEKIEELNKLAETPLSNEKV